MYAGLMRHGCSISAAQTRPDIVANRKLRLLCAKSKTSGHKAGDLDVESDV